MKNWLLNLKISKKLIFGFLVVTILGVIIGIVGIVNIITLRDNEKHLYNVNTTSAVSIGNAQADLLSIRVALRDIIIHNNENKNTYYETIEAKLADAVKQMDEYAEYLSDQQDQDNINAAKKRLPIMNHKWSRSLMLRRQTNRPRL